MVRDTLLIALYAAVGAAGAGLLGMGLLRLLRNRSVALSLTVVAAVTVAAMLAGTLLVSWAMLLSDHDLWVVTMVCLMAAVVSLAVALALGRRVVRGSRALTEATRSLGDNGRFT
ncbi:two-component sensor histidine kinase, partial [Streptomyces sp. SID89]|nr:two-component sensor histidine kinase [Streptomyces sp. SID89]